MPAALGEDGAVAGWLRRAAGRSTVEATTVGRRSGKPRTVRIWFVADGTRVWLQAGKGGRRSWYRNALANPHVKLDFGEVVLEGVARPERDPDRVRRAHLLFRRKYWLARIAGWLGSDIGTGEVLVIDRLRVAEQKQAPGQAEDPMS